LTASSDSRNVRDPSSRRKPMHRSLFITALALVCTSAPASAQVGAVGQLRWMAGCWERRVASKPLVEEQWMAPRANVMLGAGRTTRGDTLVTEYEQTRISAIAGSVVFHAEPAGQPPADFTAMALDDTMVVFANPAHDFPQRVIYRSRGADSLVARVEGTSGGRDVGIDFRYARVRCGGS
jgi:hypothetical protein